MKIFVRAKPGAREERVEKTDDSHFTVSVTEPPREGKANAAIVAALAAHLNVPQWRVSIVAGRTSRNKIVEILSAGE
ncbi:MAG: DUF167 domain-containing protein [Candidatus Jorgensenbacteria bacterium]